MNKIEALNEKALANRLSRDYPAQAAELRRVAAQLAASNDNGSRRVAA